MSESFIDTIAPEPVEEEEVTETTEEVVEEKAEEPEKTEEEKEEKEVVEPVPTVPLAALREERERRQELQQRLDDTQQKIGKMEALFERFQGGETEELPNYEDDPAGFLKASIEKMQSQLEQMGQSQSERAKQEEAHQQERQLLDQYAASVRAYQTQQPDFNDAYAFLAQAIDQDLAARGITDPTERANILQFEEGQMVGRALRNGANPAELIYNYAKTRGYAKEEKTEEDKLERLEKGQKAAQSLSDTGGGGERPTTLERLAELSGDEFDKAWNEAQRKGMLG